MCNLYTYKLSRDEIRGLMEHYKLIGTEWAEQFDNGCVQRRVSFWSITPNLS